MKDGELLSVGGRFELRFTRELAHPVSKVWDAITTPTACAAGSPSTSRARATTGAPLRFVFREGEGDDFAGSMVEFEPRSVMELRWEDDETLRLELAESGDGCVLTLINRFDEIGKAARDAAGWHACLDALEALLDGSSLDASAAGSPSTRTTSSRFGPEGRHHRPTHRLTQIHPAAGTSRPRLRRPRGSPRAPSPSRLRRPPRLLRAAPHRPPRRSARRPCAPAGTASRPSDPVALTAAINDQGWRPRALRRSATSRPGRADCANAQNRTARTGVSITGRTRSSRRVDGRRGRLTCLSRTVSDRTAGRTRENRTTTPRSSRAPQRAVRQWRARRREPVWSHDQAAARWRRGDQGRT